jgi:hypothetical protein
MGDDEHSDEQVKEENDGIMALGRGWAHICMGDVDGIGQVKKEGEGVKLGEVRHVSTSVSHAW